MVSTTSEAPFEVTDAVGAEVALVEETAPAADDLVEDELLVEEISIDGMCGVY